VKLQKGCAFTGPIKDRYECTSVSKGIERLLVRMINFSGFKNDQVNIYSSDEVEWAVTGLDTNDFVCIIVNENDVAKSEELVTSVLAHELGHIYRRHVYMASDLNAAKEFQADYYSGFWSSRAKRSEANAILPLNEVEQDAVHPAPALRIDTLKQGFVDANQPFDTSHSFAPDNVRYKEVLDLFMAVNAYKNNADKFMVSFQLVSKDPSIPNDAVVSKIEKVSYVLHETFKHPFVTSFNPNKDNFKYNIIVWGSFAVIALVYFKDGSILPIIKSFTLPNQSKKSEQ